MRDASPRLFDAPSDWRTRLARLRGSTVLHDLSRYGARLDAITALDAQTREMSDTALRAAAAALRARAHSGEPLSSVTVPLFALAREAAHRAIGERPFDEQVLAALALSDGFVVEMQTGEGKTLAATMPAALLALTGRGVHVLTFNDYLARRDAAWMAPVYGRLGLDAGAVDQRSSSHERRAAYRADVTYVTAKEAGFDHLRDLLAREASALVHRPFHAAIVDEADSLMIDEARVPLVIAGQVGPEGTQAPRLAALVASMAAGVHFSCDEYARDVELTEAGLEFAETSLACGSLHAAPNVTLLTELNCALHARVLLHRDVDYIVRDERVVIVDEFTGRVVPDRHWPDGLQAALEAKEGLPVRDGGHILGSMTMHRFLRGYPTLCGMTGTARDAAEELGTFYGRSVAVIPTHRPARRLDHEDVLFSHREARDEAVVREIREAHASGRPVLVGTASVSDSERLARHLSAANVDCAVLNARNDEEEARVIARAGALGAVTISTNMAGRGTDIRLGGPDEADRDRVAALGGLYVIGTQRHESQRVDRQLRGRAGRQGDPGTSRFFVSLEDDLLVRYRIADLIPRRFMPARSDAPVDHPVIRREAARAQRIVEGQNFEIRRTLARYTRVLEDQHRLFVERRRGVLEGTAACDAWARLTPGRRRAMVCAVGEAAVADAERQVTLACLDRAWREHLAACADVREGIHLVRLGGRDPLTTFTAAAIESFSDFDGRVEDDVVEAIEAVRVTEGAITLAGSGLEAPASTWTYLVNDDPFERRLGTLLTGPGGATVAIYAAVMLMPLLVAWGVVDRWLRPGRRPAPPS